MCCTFERSEMSETKVYVGEGKRNEKTVHVLAYQNTADTNAPNAMVLPFPTDAKMGQDNVIDTRKFKSFLKDITSASQHHTKSMSRGLTLGAASFGMDSLAEVFDVGSYTVILADNVMQIPEALTRVARDKRPNVSTDFLIGYGELYPNQPIAVCCWNGAIEAEPLMWWYEPRDKSTLFIPTMDAHDGRAPKRGARVGTDHIVSVGASNGNIGSEVRYTESRSIPDDVKELLPLMVHGKRLPELLPNGDCFVKTATLHSTREQLFSGGAPAVQLVREDYTTVMNGWT